MCVWNGSLFPLASVFGIFLEPQTDLKFIINSTKTKAGIWDFSWKIVSASESSLSPRN